LIHIMIAAVLAALTVAQATVQAFLPGALSVLPQIVQSPHPPFLHQAGLLGPTGEMRIELLVDPSGSVRDVRVSAPFAGAELYTAQAVEALRAWKFEAGRKDGVVVASIVTVRFEFGLGVPRLGRGGAQRYGSDMHIEGAEDPFVNGVARVSDPGVTAPRLKKSVEPKYPAKDLRDQIEGSVSLEAIIDVTGEVRAVRVTHSLTPGLDDAAMAAARKWRFEPARLNGAPTPILVTLILDFRLKR
jgi:TonB family protein